MKSRCGTFVTSCLGKSTFLQVFLLNSIDEFEGELRSRKSAIRFRSPQEHFSVNREDL